MELVDGSVILKEKKHIFLKKHTLRKIDINSKRNSNRKVGKEILISITDTLTHIYNISGNVIHAIQSTSHMNYKNLGGV